MHNHTSKDSRMLALALPIRRGKVPQDLRCKYCLPRKFLLVSQRQNECFGKSLETLKYTPPRRLGFPEFWLLILFL